MGPSTPRDAQEEVNITSDDEFPDYDIHETSSGDAHVGSLKKK